MASANCFTWEKGDYLATVPKMFIQPTHLLKPKGRICQRMGGPKSAGHEPREV